MVMYPMHSEGKGGGDGGDGGGNGGGGLGDTVQLVPVQPAKHRHNHAEPLYNNRSPPGGMHTGGCKELAVGVDGGGGNESASVVRKTTITTPEPPL